MLPVIVGAIVAGASLASSAYSNYKANEAAKDAKNEAKKQAAEYAKWANELVNEVSRHNATTNGYGTLADVGNYRDVVNKLDYEAMYNKFWDRNGDGIADDPDEFNYGKNVEDFYNPNRQKLIDNVALKTMGAALGAGGGRSTDAAIQVGNAVADKNEQLYSNALNAYNSDREFAYKSWSDYLTQRRNQYNDLVGATNSNVELLKGLADSYLEEQQNEFSNLINAKMAAQGVVVNGNNAVNATGNYTPDYGQTVGNAVNAFGTMYQSLSKPTGGNSPTAGNSNTF